MPGKAPQKRLQTEEDVARETWGVGVEVRMWLAQILSSIPKTDFFFPFQLPPFMFLLLTPCYLV